MVCSVKRELPDRNDLKPDLPAVDPGFVRTIMTAHGLSACDRRAFANLTGRSVSDAAAFVSVFDSSSQRHEVRRNDANKKGATGID